MPILEGSKKIKKNKRLSSLKKKADKSRRTSLRMKIPQEGFLDEFINKTRNEFVNPVFVK